MDPGHTSKIGVAEGSAFLINRSIQRRFSAAHSSTMAVTLQTTHYFYCSFICLERLFLQKIHLIFEGLNHSLELYFSISQERRYSVSDEE